MASNLADKLQELVKLRNEKAGLLGYGTHADFILDARMAKTKEKVKSFLDDMVAKMETPLKRELDGTNLLSNFLAAFSFYLSFSLVLFLSNSICLSLSLSLSLSFSRSLCVM